jgi:hypothetical protein
MAHCITIFHQMLKLIPRHIFAKLGTEQGAGLQTRSFPRWSQLAHLLFKQLTARDGKRRSCPPQPREASVGKMV